jgi:hypothetical protein
VRKGNKRRICRCVNPHAKVFVVTGSLINAEVNILRSGENDIAAFDRVDMIVYQKGNIAGEIQIDLIVAVDMGFIGLGIIGNAVSIGASDRIFDIFCGQQGAPKLGLILHKSSLLFGLPVRLWLSFFAPLL